MNSSKVIALSFIATLVMWAEYAFWIVGEVGLFYSIGNAIAYIIHIVLGFILAIALFVALVYIMFYTFEWFLWAIFYSNVKTFRDHMYGKKVKEERDYVEY